MKSCLLLLSVLTAAGPLLAQEKPMNSSTNRNETAVFGGGCYWCTEAIYQMLPGVKSVTSGFSGGTKPSPTYEEVCAGTTGHAEVIEIEYDPSVISYEKVLHTFWEVHDPTTLNRQGHDVGTQYRSIILYKTPAEKAAAEKSKAEAQKNFNDPIVTQIVPLEKFWKADDYHQNYFRTHPNQPYCRAVIRPKVEKFEKKLKQEVK
jgi:peptide-methionine (S)-S-oxide reductase